MASEIKYGISRFSNIGGVTCYMNSILAILQQTPIFTEYILTAQFKDKLQFDNPSELTKSIIFQLHNLIKISHSHDNFKIAPSSFRTAVSSKDSMWGMQHHQDSQEFLSFLLNSIEEEISQKVIFVPGRLFGETTYNSPLLNIMANNIWQLFIKKEYSIIKNLFGGMTIMKTTCQFCSNESHNFDIFQTLQLSIPSVNKEYTLDECMDEYIKNETVDYDNRISCDFCGRKNKSIKKNMIWKSPKILIIQLKRFKTNDYGIISRKITNMVTYPKELDISKYIDSNSPYKKDCIYNLYAINLHHSIGMFNTINSGHYTSIVINRHNNTWYEFDDDDDLTVVNEEDLVNRNAYMLFYYRNN